MAQRNITAGNLAARRVPKHIVQMFEKYMDNQVRHLEKNDAINMLMKEYSLDHTQAEQIFLTFDKDKNDLLSIWEFQHFYMCAGNNSAEIVEKFMALDTDGSGILEYDEAARGLASMKTADGRALAPQEVDFFLKTAADENNKINLGEFVNLLARLKLYRAPAPKPGQKLKYVKPSK
ncbi:unnamed protein product [Owenia fusiformis]|uniref:Uncharacterized protein n=1 Tax=Owenia fusiformis TaxID=6347 RepID=A0A8J1TQH0_OWEFU|nr:unnamed protein product [Owenia fusiformis]